MDRYSRRKLLGLSAVSLAGIAGCTGSDDSDTDNSNGGGGRNEARDEETERPDADDDGVFDSQDDYPYDEALSRKQTTSDTRKLEEDEWRYYEIDFNNTGYVSYDFIVRDGPAIDAIFIEQSEYSYFDNGDRYEYKPTLSALDSAGSEVSSKVPAGSYYLIFDNSSRGEAVPPANFSNDVITVEFELEVGQ